PSLAVVARDVKRPVIRSGPNHSLLEWRLRDRIQRAVKLFTRYVARDRLTARALATRRMRRQIRRDAFPRHAFVTRAMHKLRSVIEHIRIVRRRGHRRYALHSIDQV